MSDLIFLALILGAAGGLAGFLAGVFGVGGGTVVVPVLYEVFVILGVPDDLRMPLCAGTSLALIIPTSIASFTSHRKTNAVNFDLLRLWSVPIIAGVIGGTVLARYAPAAVFLQLRIAVWTGDTRDTRPTAVIRRVEISQRSSTGACYSFRSEARRDWAVKRRKFITLLGGAAAWPLAARPQQPTATA